jgi:hypothetical protein
MNICDEELPVMKTLAANFESSHDILLWFKQKSDEIGIWHEASKLSLLFNQVLGPLRELFHF